MTKPAIYLDHNATASMRPQARDVMAALLGEPLNASSVHGPGRKARAVIEDARKKIAEALNCFHGEIIFCGSGTEANNLALNQVSGLRLQVSAIEHASVLKAAKQRRPGVGRDIIAVNESGVIDLAALDRALSNPSSCDLIAGSSLADKLDAAVKPQHDGGKYKTLISVMLANNETGVIQPIREVVEIARKYGALVHCDAVQALGKIPLDFSALGVDMMTVSAHKMGGPVGAAALVVRDKLPISPLLLGGGQEKNRRAGTENVAAIAGFAKAVELIDLGHMRQLRNWLDEMEKNISSPFQWGENIIGARALRLPNTSCIAMPGVPSETQLISFDLEGIAVSAGSACTSGRIEPSHVLKAMGVEDALAGTAIRVSGGWNTQETDIKAFARAWKTLYQRTAGRAA